MKEGPAAAEGGDREERRREERRGPSTVCISARMHPRQVTEPARPARLGHRPFSQFVKFQSCHVGDNEGEVCVVRG